jgi:chloramphenicol 3-O-phosphotransferase
MKSVIMLSGPIGAGKTTVARELVSLMQGEVAYIEGDSFWSFLSKTGSLNRRDNFPIILRSMTAAALPMARSGYDVVLDFSIPPDFLPIALKILKDTPLDFVVLLPSLDACELRAANRAEGVISDYQRYRSFYAMFLAAAERFTVGDTADARTTALRILEGLRERRFRVV